jgi:hypothetical protein
MKRREVLGIVCVMLIVLFAAMERASAAGLPQEPAQKAASAAASASPELIGALSKELGSTPEQAAGAAGALFGVAKSKLSPAEFSQVASAVPGIDSLLSAAPGGAAVGTTGAGGLSQVAGAAGGLASAATAFTKLGLKPDMVAKAIPVLTSFVSKSGGANVANLLAGALK